MKPQDIKVERAKKFLIERDGEKCNKCGGNNELTIDHIVPQCFLAMMGLNNKHTYSPKKHGHNLQLLCRKCNSLKAGKFDWLDTRTRPLIDWYLNSIDSDLSEQE